ncbi:MAG: VanW family protein [Trueperella sp.]|nr:VanW family protein [Trueperella sp.]
MEKISTFRKYRWAWLAGAVVLLLAAIYLGLALLFANKVPSGTEVAGVSIGGLDRAVAAEKLETELAAAVAQPREVTVPDAPENREIDPKTISAQIDTERTLAEIVGFSLNPVRIVNHLFGGPDAIGYISADDAALRSEAKTLAEFFDREPTNASVKLDGVTPKVVPDRDGVRIDQGEAAAAIKSGWLQESDKPLELPVITAGAKLQQAAVQDFVDKSFGPLFSAPISVQIKDQAVEFSAQDLASFVTFTDAEDTPGLVVDSKIMSALVAEKNPGLLQAGADAQIVIVNHSHPQIIPGTDGEIIDAAQLAQDLIALGDAAERAVTAQVVVGPPAFDTADAEKMGVKEVVSQIATPLPEDAVRSHNVILGAQRVSNVLIKPGERFNYGAILGPITAANGFRPSGVIIGGVSTQAMGGGLSQLSTNMFNIGYRAGMVDVAHQPHTKHYSRYPAGLESTYWEGQIEMIWENNTPYGAVVESWISGGYLHSRLWSTKYWDVQVWQGKPYNYTEPGEKESNLVGCIPENGGKQGYTITVGRKVSRNGQVHEDSSYTWTYHPWHRVICTENN